MKSIATCSKKSTVERTKKVNFYAHGFLTNQQLVMLVAWLFKHFKIRKEATGEITEYMKYCSCVLAK